MSGRVIVITSGKGGVGKTTTNANIGTALAKAGKKVVMIDTDLGLRNLDLLLGLENRIVYTIVDVVEERCKLKQALVKDKKNPNLCLLAAAQTRDKTAVTEEQLKKICEELQKDFDFILVDCPAGIEQGFQNAVAGASEAIVVTTPEMSAVRDADRIIGLLEAKEEEQKRKIENDKLIKEKKAEIKENEDRLIQRENNIDKRDQLLQKRETTLDERENKIFERQKEIQDEQARVDEIKQEQLELLEKISGFDKEKARKLVMNRVEEAMQKEIAEYIKEQENNAKMEADKKAKDLIVTAMQRFAADIANDQTITVVTLPNDEMKGRIIGREGRNIRTLEAITGVDLIIDDTPEAVVLSSFDPLRREIARVTLETLMKDGRIHPTRIEELYDKVCKDMKAKILEYYLNWD